MSLQITLVVIVLCLIAQSSAFNVGLKSRSIIMSPELYQRSNLVMKVPTDNDAFAKANRSQRRAGADDRIVELKMVNSWLICIMICCF